MGKGGKGLVPAADAGLKKYTMAEVKQHAKPGDAWLVIRNKVYDVSAWRDHPGGKVLLTAAGGDATDTFAAFHSPAAHGVMERFLIGVCPDADRAANVHAKPSFESDYRALIASAKSRGWFKASKLYYAWKFASTTAILALSVYLCTLAGSSVQVHMLAALVLGLFWQQAGWLAHDFAHHQVFTTRALNDYACMLVTCMLGFSLDWWRNKHNTHHAVPNVHESTVEAHDGDPDIDTLPFLAWSRKFLAKVAPDAAFSRFCVARQHLLFFPLLLFARTTWAMQSLAYVFRLEVAYWGATDAASRDAAAAAKLGNAVKMSEVRLRYETWERVALIVHYLWQAVLMYTTMPSIATAFAFFAVSQMSSGLLIALAFGVGHNGMSLYDVDAIPGFGELQVSTTRNVEDSLFMGWFMGGLHYQVEHHLFPTMPRHNLAKVAPLVRAMCAKHGVEYRCTTLYQGTAEVLGHLRELALELQNGPM